MEKVKFIMSGLWDFLQPIIKMLTSEAGRVLAASAIMAVRAVAESMTASSGAEKRETAFRMITDDLKRQGINLGASAVNMALEAAVAKYKAKEVS